MCGMTLQEFMEREKLDDAAFGALVGKDRSVVSRWRRGLTRPDWPMLPVIEKATRGDVTAQDFVHLEAAQ